MNEAPRLIVPFRELRITDIGIVGGKNAALGELFSVLVSKGINVPDGFAITADAYRFFITSNKLQEAMDRELKGLNTHNIRDLQRRGKRIRTMVERAKMPPELAHAILKAYASFEEKFGKNLDVAVRSSATAEDLPGASFAGQQETYLNVRGGANVLDATRRCFASLFTDRAISYRVDKGFAHIDVALSVGIQVMVRSDLASSGVAFTVHTETGFKNVVVVTASYGLGEMIVQGKVMPDEYVVFKPSLAAGKKAIIERNLGSKEVKLIYAKHGTKQVPVPPAERGRYALTDKEVQKLATWCVSIETYFSKRNGHPQPMDIEWAKDGRTGELFIVQARPETIHASADARVHVEYELKKQGTVIATGIAVGAKIGAGNARVISNARAMHSFKPGEILVTEITDPDWEPIMKIAGGIVTNKGGRTSHAAIVSRELGVPCIVGTESATRIIKTGKPVTVDCSSGEVGRVYAGKLPFTVTEHKLDNIPETRTKIMVNVASPDGVFRFHTLPVKGVGLGRLEFIIASHVKVHPNALLDYPILVQEARGDRATHQVVQAINALTVGYDKKTDYYVDKLSEGIAKVAATFWPNDVIIRFSDFKTNEYRTLLGGSRYEPVEENPMLGWRGASRYYDPKFTRAFALECRAIARVRGAMGLANVIPMVPFCRTVDEGKQVLAVMEKNGLARAKDKGLKVYMMCEIPSNVLLADAFLDLYDGMSIGSNDLTQLTLGLDRDSGIVAHVGNENDEAVKKLIADVIAVCHRRKKYIGICGQAPSDYPDFAAFLVKQGIDSMSLNPDVVMKVIMAVAKQEKKI